MRTINLRFSGLSLALAVLATMLVFAASAQAQTPTEDQYGSPTDPSASASAPAGDPAGASSVESSSGGDVTSDVVLPSTGGAPIYLALAGAILMGTSATLWLRLRTGSH